MCDPTGGVATYLAIAAAVTGATATVYGGIQQGRMDRYNAEVAGQNAIYSQRSADDALNRGKKEELEHYQALARLRGEQQAGYAASGIDTSFGSPLDIMGDTAALGNADAQTIRENASREAQGFLIQKNNFLAEQSAGIASAQAGGITTALKAGATLLGGAGEAYSSAAKYGVPSWMKGATKTKGIGMVGSSFA